MAQIVAAEGERVQEMCWLAEGLRRVLAAAECLDCVAFQSH